MAMLDPFAPIPFKETVSSKFPVLYNNELAYTVEKTSFVDDSTGDIYYKLLFIKFFIDNNKVKVKTFHNDFQLFSGDFFITFFPSGELITNKDILRIKNISLLKTFSINNIISFKNKNHKSSKINLVKKDNHKSFFLNFFKKFKKSKLK